MRAGLNLHRVFKFRFIGKGVFKSNRNEIMLSLANKNVSQFVVLGTAKRRYFN